MLGNEVALAQVGLLRHKKKINALDFLVTFIASYRCSFFTLVMRMWRNCCVINILSFVVVGQRVCVRACVCVCVHPQPVADPLAVTRIIDELTWNLSVVTADWEDALNLQESMFQCHFALHLPSNLYLFKPSVYLT